MCRYTVSLPAVFALSIVLAGCDSFAVLGQFSNGSPLTLTLQESSVQQGAATSLYPGGGKPPYSFGVVAGNIYYPGTLGSVSGEVYTAGNAIGTVIIHLTDAADDAVDAVVTIIPPTPASFNVQPDTATGTANDIALSWSYGNTALVSSFLIQHSNDGVTFADLTSVPSSATSYVDSPLNPNQTYYYRMYAVSGPARSLPTGVMGSTP